MDVRDRTLLRIWVRGNFDLVAQAVPVRAHDDDAFSIVRESLVAALLPVISRLGLLAQHHGRAMREEMDRCKDLF